jgi:hypothetical protein
LPPTGEYGDDEHCARRSFAVHSGLRPRTPDSGGRRWAAMSHLAFAGLAPCEVWDV